MEDNLKIAISRGVWGCPGRQSGTIEDGDWVVFGSGVPDGPRQEIREWFRKTAESVFLVRATSTWFESEAPIWPGPVPYKHRFTFDPDSVRQFHNVSLQPDLNLSAEGGRALRRAGLIVADGALQCQNFGSGGVLLFEGESIGNDDGSFVATEFEGDLDIQTSRAARAEQAALRRRLLKRNNSCAICARILPDELLVAAHIKKRSECNDDEKRDLDNVAMLACKLGCDAFFEYGYIVVDETGVVIITAEGNLDGPQRSLLEDLAERRCSAHSPKSERYFQWHRTTHDPGRYK
jgi:hypothetical protein